MAKEELVIRCTMGLFKGKFFYVNPTAEGEVIGAGEPERDRLTLSIENANLALRHTQICYVGNSYYLRDLGSELGTWLYLTSEVATPYQLELNDIIRLGTTVFTIAPGATCGLVMSSPKLTIPLDSPTITIGSANSDYIIPNSLCRIFSDNDVFYIQSHLGTVYKKLLPHMEYRLTPGMTFKIGLLEFTALRYNYGVASCTSTYTVVPSLSQDPSTPYFAVFDGPLDCAQFLATNLHFYIHSLTEEGFCHSFAQCAQEFSGHFTANAALVLIQHSTVISCRLGSTRVLLSRTAKCIDLSHGDSSVPQVATRVLSSADEFILLATDSLFEVFEPQEAVSFIAASLRRMAVTEQDPSRAANELLSAAVNSRFSSQNITILIIPLSPGLV